MTDPDVDAARLQEQVTELASQIADELGPERGSAITAQLARLLERTMPDPGPALDEAHAALQSAPGAPADAGERRSRKALAAAVHQLSDEVVAHRAALQVVLSALGDSFRTGTHHHPDLEGELDALHDRFATADRSRTWTATDLDILSRLEALERAVLDASPRPGPPQGEERPAPDESTE